ncbi:unnamed protein product [Protopolystoma xenopodis]|uniref:Uncharacterized protein n=1 Tax=Protopolystoma xenopodis TaxID=117903 RepID=A0A3S5FBX1_9PLAT|nr:unnamed protein product [Protopolystoma xenopodis]
MVRPATRTSDDACAQTELFSNFLCGLACRDNWFTSRGSRPEQLRFNSLCLQASFSLVHYFTPLHLLLSFPPTFQLPSLHQCLSAHSLSHISVHLEIIPETLISRPCHLSLPPVYTRESLSPATVFGPVNGYLDG